MNNSEASLLYLLLGVTSGFTVFIFFLLKARRTLQLIDSQMIAETIWKTISSHALELNLSRTSLLFGHYQDVTSTELALIVKDSNDQVIGEVRRPSVGRKRTLKIGNDNFEIEFLLSWKRTAVLRSLSDRKILAKFTQTGWLGKHQIDVTGFGKLNAIRSSFGFNVGFDYKFDGKIIGTTQRITSIREIGKLVILPQDIHPAVRTFVLAL